jgi:predicted NBD/HSP70 family sugar kinase
VARGGSRSHAWIRHHNRALVLATIRRHGAVSRPVIERETNLALPTVLQITNALIEDGMLVETAVGPSTGGRPPTLLALRADFGYAIGVKLQNDRATAAVVDFSGVIVSRHEAAVRTDEPRLAVDDLAAFVRRIIGAANPTVAGAVLGVGVAAPGVVDYDRGVMRNSPPLGWHDVPAGTLLGDLVPYPVWVDNDVNVLAQDLALFGLGQKLDHFLVLTVGRGVGLGIVTGGRVYRGHRGGAAEVGHVPWPDAAGRMCTCGRRGCFETLVADEALVREYEALGGDRVSVDELRGRARAGDARATAVYRRAGERLGQLLGMLVTLLAPQAVILSGEGTRVGPALLDAIRNTWQSQAMAPQRDDVEVVVDEWDDHRWARGAASLVFDHVIFPTDVRELARR